MSTTESYLAQLRAAREKRLAKIAPPASTVRDESEDVVTLTKGQLSQLLNETISAVLEKQQRVETLEKRYAETQQVELTGDPEIDEYVQDVKEGALQDRHDLMRKAVVMKLRKSRVLNWNKGDDYTPVRPGQHVSQGEGESSESFRSRAHQLPVAGTRESVTSMTGGGMGNERKAKREAEKQ